jgi:hypothetical protein
MYVEGGKSGKQGLIKEHIKETLSWLGFSRFNDYHVWHPTYLELISLLEASGFKVTKEHWQEGYNNTVVYLKCAKE